MKCLCLAIVSLLVSLSGVSSQVPADVVAAAGSGQVSGEHAALPQVAPPLTLETSACEAAGSLMTLATVAATDLPGLHHMYTLSENIISGAEPEGEEALKQLADMGVKTILSVDGKAPDAATARKYGLRYVHVPIQYKGLSSDEVLAISKTFREAEGPFYVHCFHGQHRGPAAAALGRLVLDGASREQAIAEMRQWAGTSPKYEGLYQSLAAGFIPTSAQTAALAIELPEVAPLAGTGAFMVQVSRPFDALKGMSKNQWQVPTNHPDLDPVNEAAILAGLFARSGDMHELAGKPADFQQWIADSIEQTRALAEALVATRSSQSDETWARVDAAFQVVGNTCNACHKAYRDN